VALVTLVVVVLLQNFGRGVLKLGAILLNLTLPEDAAAKAGRQKDRADFPSVRPFPAYSFPFLASSI
jgi:xanthine/uracil permease